MHSINNCGNSRCNILPNVYGHEVIAVDQSHAIRILHSAFYFPHSAFIDNLAPRITHYGKPAKHLLVISYA